MQKAQSGAMTLGLLAEEECLGVGNLDLHPYVSCTSTYFSKVYNIICISVICPVDPTLCLLKLAIIKTHTW